MCVIVLKGCHFRARVYVRRVLSSVYVNWMREVESVRREMIGLGQHFNPKSLSEILFHQTLHVESFSKFSFDLREFLLNEYRPKDTITF